MSAPPITAGPLVLSFSRAAVHLRVTECELRKAARLGLLPDRGTCGRSRVVLVEDLPAIEAALRQAGIIRDPDVPRTAAAAPPQGAECSVAQP